MMIILKLFSRTLIVYFVLFISERLIAQQTLPTYTEEKVVHSFGVSMDNGIYLPEKVYNSYGLIKRVPKAGYGYEFDINYSPILYKGFGINIDLIVFGSIPDHYALSSRGNIKTDTAWANGFVGNPIDGGYSTSGVPYFGLNVLLNYTFNPIKHLTLQPAIGVKLPAMVMWGAESDASFGGTDPNNTINFYHSSYDNSQSKRLFYPDLLVGMNFLVYFKNPKHCLKIGTSFDYSFIYYRAQGSYEVYNIGNQYNSGGNVKYGSTHFNISIGYQFIAYKKTYLKTGKKENLPQEKF